MANGLRGAGGCWCLLLLGAVSAGRCRAAEDDQASWRVLPLVAGGRIAPEWKHLWGGGFSVMDDGSLRTDCDDAGMGLLLYAKERFGDCRIRVEWKTMVITLRGNEIPAPHAIR